MIKHYLTHLFPTSEKKEKAYLPLCKGILQYWPCVDFKAQEREMVRRDAGSTSRLWPSF